MLIIYRLCGQPSLVFHHSFSGIKRTGREDDHSFPASSQAANEWSYTFTPPTRLQRMYRDYLNCTLCYRYCQWLKLWKEGVRVQLAQACCPKIFLDGMNETIKRPVRINCVLATIQFMHLPNTSQKCYSLKQIARSENQNTSRFEKGICKPTVVVALI